MMDLLWYKLTLAPVMVAVATLLGRRYGQTAAGLVAGLPIVAGPILWFYASEQGVPYAQAAAVATLLGLFSLSLFAVAYAWRAWMGGSVLSSLVLGWVAFLLATFIIERLMGTRVVLWPKGLLIALASLFLAVKSLPPVAKNAVVGIRTYPAWDLPLRMAATGALVWGLTHFAQMLGPKLGGLLTPFPVASTVLTVFAHQQGGSDAARSVLKGLLLALNAFAVFCAALALSLPALGLGLGFVVALIAATLVQAGMVYWQWKSRAA
jgi:hypothetical protein